MDDTPKLSAHQFPQVYQDLGYDLSKLGCIMLPIVQDDDLMASVTGTISDDDLYVASDPLAHPWVNGIVLDKAHVTLLFGLLRTGPEMKKHVDAVLDGNLPNEIAIDHIDYFDSPLEDEPYYCLIAHVKVSDELQGAHDRLTFLPHIDTFPGYKPHMTLAYIKKSDEARDQYIQQLNSKLRGMILTTDSALNYGGNK